MSSTYRFQNSIWQIGFKRALFSKYWIVNSAISTEIGEPIGVPIIYWKRLSLRWKVVDCKHSLTNWIISFVCKGVRFINSLSLSSDSVMESTARTWGGTSKQIFHVERDHYYSLVSPDFPIHVWRPMYLQSTFRLIGC